MRCASCRRTASAEADAPSPGTALFCSSGICVERASNQVIRLERRLPTLAFGIKGLSIYGTESHRRRTQEMGSQWPRATLRREIHAAQEVLEARVGAPGVPIPPCTQMNQGRLRSWQASSSHSRARSFSPAWAHTVAPYARPEHRFDLNAPPASPPSGAAPPTSQPRRSRAPGLLRLHNRLPRQTPP